MERNSRAAPAPRPLRDRAGVPATARAIPARSTAPHGDCHDWQGNAPAWDSPAGKSLDFFDLKGLIEALLDALHVDGCTFDPAEDSAFHPGKCAAVQAGDVVLGVIGELHPLVKENYDFASRWWLLTSIWRPCWRPAPARFPFQGVTDFPPILEDIAVVVDEAVPAARIEALIRQTGGKLLAGARLFDIFRGPQIGEGKKSMAYGLTYQASDRTLTDTDAAALRGKIIRRLEQELGAKLRS